MPVEGVGGQIQRRQQVTDTVGSAERCPPASPPGLIIATLGGLGSGRCPLPSATGQQVERPELVHAHHHRGVPHPGLGLALGDVVELQDPVLFGFEVGVGGLFQVLIT